MLKPMPTKSRAARSVESDPDDGDSGADDEGDVGEGEAAAPRLLDTSGSNAPRPPPTCDADEKQAARAQKRFKTMKAESRSLHGERALARIGVATIFATSSLPRCLKEGNFGKTLQSGGGKPAGNRQQTIASTPPPSSARYRRACSKEREPIQIWTCRRC